MVDMQEDNVNEFFHKDIEKLAKHYAVLFFSDKRNFLNGPISPHYLEGILEEKRFISLIMNLSISDGMLYIYDIISNNKGRFKNEIKFDKSFSDVKYVISLLNQCGRLGIPQRFRAGIIVLYFSICKGCKIKV